MAQKKILIVEDDPAIQRMYKRILSKKRVIILAATDTDTAKALFLANPDITDVILDGEVPGSMTTAQLAAEFRKSSNCRLVAIVGSLGISSELVKLCDAALEKPTETSEFLEALGLS